MQFYIGHRRFGNQFVMLWFRHKSWRRYLIISASISSDDAIKVLPWRSVFHTSLYFVYLFPTRFLPPHFRCFSRHSVGSGTEGANRRGCDMDSHMPPRVLILFGINFQLLLRKRLCCHKEADVQRVRFSKWSIVHCKFNWKMECNIASYLEHLEGTSESINPSKPLISL